MFFCITKYRLTLLEVIMKNRVWFVLCFLLVGLQAFAQVSVSGKVVEEATGYEVIGANVVVKGTTVGTMTGVDGTFQLADIPGGENAILEFSFIGFKTQEVKVGTQREFNIKLAEDSEMLEEVVVVGYGTARKKDVSGAISNVKFADSDVTALPNPNALAALSSKVAGMSYAPTSSAGESNMSTMTIRGKNAIPQSTDASDQSVNQPLLIVDGVISFGSINEINTNDIQSIDVLKDASAAAIYGSRAANGVIVITTKKGLSETPTINFNANWSFSDWARMPKMVDDEEKFMKNRFYSKQAAGSIPADAVYSSNYDKAMLLNSTELDAYNEGIYTNWLDEVSRIGFAQKYDVSVSGKSKIVSYYTSADYYRQEGIMKGNDYEKYNILAKMDFNLTDWLTMGIKGNYLSSRSWGVPARMQNATWMSPYSYVHARQEGYEDWYNSNPDGNTASPYWGSGANDSHLWTDKESHGQNVNGVFYGQIDFPFLKGLSYRFTLNAQSNTSSVDLFDNPEMWVNTNNTAQMDDPSQFGKNAGGYAYTDRSTTWNVDNILTYNKDLGAHHMDFMLGYTRESYNWERLRIDFKDFSTPTVLGVYGAESAATRTVTRDRTRTQAVAYLGRANYNYKNTYYATFNFRRDGFSAFAPGSKWGNFFGASAAWVVSNEAFMQDNVGNWMDYLKLRLSWGQNGSRSVSAYSTLSTVSSTYTWFGDAAGGSTLGYYPYTLPNKTLTWATVEKYNVGIDYGFLQGRIGGSLDIYTGKTTDMLLSRSVPYPTGFSTAKDNAGKVTNKGFEFTMNTVNIDGDGKDKFRWTTNLVFDLNRNKIKSLFGKNWEGKESDDVANAVAYGFDSYYALVIGQAIGAAYDLKKLGIFQSQEEIDNYVDKDGNKIQPNAVPGDIKFLDYNEDGKISGDDRHYIGDMNPLFTMNLGNTLAWKNFSLYFNFRWMQGNDEHFLGYDPNAFGTSMTSGAQLDAVEPWTTENHSDKYPRYGWTNTNNYLFWNTRSFLKLKDLVLSYNIEADVLKKLAVSKCRVYLSATDLFTITGWSGLDSENGGTIAAGASSSRYGSNGTFKTVSLGVNLSF